MTALHFSQQNQLLAALSPNEVKRLNLQLTSLPLGKVLHEPEQAQPYIYFPVDCIVSLLYVLNDGDSAEISVVGNGHSGHAPPRRFGNKFTRFASAVEKTVVGVQMQMNEGRCFHAG